jgi:hypothetical protein
VNDPIPSADRLAAEGEGLAHRRGEVGFHQPFFDQRRLRQRTPDFFDWV